MRPGRPNGLGAATGRTPTRTPRGATFVRASSATRRARAAARAMAALALSAAMALGARPAGAAEVDPGLDLPRPARDGSPGGFLSLALLSGSTQFDTGLADYQWDVTPRFGWGFLGLVGRGRLAAGLELWRAGTTQAIGGLGSAPEVHATSAELVGEVRVVERWGTRLWLRGHGGLMRLGYQPDRITIQPPGPVSPMTVDLEPVNAWTGGGGVALRHGLSDRWTLGLGIDTRRFAIDTAHRLGNEVVYARETFGDWSARCEVARTVGRR